MKIAVVVTQFPVVSSEVSVLNQITGLIDQGHEVDIFAERRGDIAGAHPQVEAYGLLARTTYREVPKNKIVRVVKAIGIIAAWIWRAPRAVFCSLNIFRYRMAAASLALLYSIPGLKQKRSFDIIHCQFGPNGIKGMFFRDSGLMTGRLITQFRGSDLNVVPREQGPNVYKRLFQEGDLFLALSEFLIGRAKALGCSDDKIRKLPLGVDISEFPFSERQIGDGSEVRILTVGRLVEVKGVEYGIRAIAQLSRRFPNVRYQIVGAGPLLDSLKELVTQLQVEKHVEFLGLLSRERLSKVYGDAHLFLYTGIVAADGGEEGLGSVLVEAQASGLPVIASRVGGIPESVREGASAVLVPQRDIDAIAEQLCQLIEQPQRWAEMGRAGCDHVLANFQNDDKVESLISLYNELLSRES
ncbi:MAG: colanic acid biosynthesis glycosyltransferase WcaL [Phycisphaerae bacterium]|nr:MAG: colanic acid biosynthesis glycosyltransferase WcaL [Phycisphaerae bacterium]